MSAGFNSRLESLRGVAALAVVFAHCMGTFKVGGSPAWWGSPFSELSTGGKILTLVSSVFSAGGAVVLFFVLSGYVLTASFVRSDFQLKSGFFPYLAKRAFRLLPAMWASILLLFVLKRAFHSDLYYDQGTSWYVGVFGELASIQATVLNMAMIEHSVNPVTWTMYIEAVGSIVLPFLFVITVTRRTVAWVCLALLLILAMGVGSGASAVQYLFCFQIGAMIACSRDVTERVSKPALAFLAGLALMAVQGLTKQHGPLGTMLLAGGSTLIIVAILQEKAHRKFMWLDLAPIRFVGKISYSLYLLHLAAIFVAAKLLAVWGFADLGYLVPQAALLGLTLAISLPLSWLSYVLIEKPAIKLGAAVSERLKRASEKGGGQPESAAGVLVKT